MTNEEALNQICEIVDQYNNQLNNDAVDFDNVEVKISCHQAVALYKAEHMFRILARESKILSDKIIMLLDIDYPSRDDYWDGYNKGYHDCEVEQQAKQAKEKKDDGSNQEQSCEQE